tara:strand:- start:21436 stop:21720 length:285 start_codon:yes stop_codon:yes gene_type:complete
MKGPMYDFFIAYVVILLLLTFLSIKEVRNEIIHIFYVLYLFLVNLLINVKKFISDCVCGNKKKDTHYIINPITDTESNQFELSTQVDVTRYVEL